MANCLNCGAGVDIGASRCFECGVKLDAEELAAVARLSATGGDVRELPDVSEPTEPEPTEPERIEPEPIEAVVEEPGPGSSEPVVEEPALVEPQSPEAAVEEPEPETIESPSMTAPPRRGANALEVAEALVEGRGRRDLAERLARARALVDGAESTVVVVGEYQQGKSSLVNAVVGADVCPVAPGRATAVPTYVRYGEGFRTAVVSRGADGAEQRIDVEADAYRLLVGDGDDDVTATIDLVAADVRIPRRALAAGLCIVDSPGVGGLDSPEASVTLAACSSADLALFVSDATQELTDPELAFIARLVERTRVAVVMTKTDLVVDPEAMLDRNRAHLRSRDLGDLDVVLVSSHLHVHAVNDADEELERHSGFAVVFGLLHDAHWAARDRIRATVGREVAAVTAQLELEVDAAERAVSGDADAVRAELASAAAQVRAARSAKAGWQVALRDGFGKLRRDAGFDIRERRLAAQRNADAELDQTDDVDAEAFQRLLQTHVMDSCLAHFDTLRGDAEALIASIDAEFVADGGLALDTATPAGAVDGAVAATFRVGGDGERVRGLLAVAQGSTSGMVMASTAFGASSLGFANLGLSVGLFANPVTPVLVGVPLGLVLGLRMIREDRKRRRQQRAHELRKASQTYLAEAFLALERDSQEVLLEIERRLREHYATRIEELESSIAHAGAAATRAGGGDVDATAERAARLAAGRDAMALVRASAARAIEAPATSADVVRAGVAPERGAPA